MLIIANQRLYILKLFTRWRNASLATECNYSALMIVVAAALSSEAELVFLHLLHSFYLLFLAGQRRTRYTAPI
jgi:hypothetical protein